MDIEEFDKHAYAYRAWPGSDQQGVVERFAELCVYVESLITAEREGAMAAILEGCPNDWSDAEIILRRAWERVRVRSNG